MLEGRILRLETRGAAADYAAHLLVRLGAEPPHRSERPDLAPALEWARSGAMALCGHAEAPPRIVPAPLASCARGALEALRALAADDPALPRDGAALLGERAAAFGYT